MNTNETMFWLGENPRRWAMLHRPLHDDPARRAVLFCPPFAEEEKLSRRLYVELARELARRGIASLRLSYRGTADSEGEFSDFRIDRAMEDVALGLEWLRREYRDAELAIFGLRLGGTLALKSAGPAVSRVALWSPVTDGRGYVRMNFRRKAIRQMINTGDAARPEAPAEAESTGIFDFDGYAVARELWDELEKLECAPPSGWKGRALAISVGGAPRVAPDIARLAETLSQKGIETRAEYVVAQPFWNLLGLVECPEIIELTAGWLAE